jgi:mRNA-degrading endonuclease RelE of RelBE toxin-antitoxin system
MSYKIYLSENFKKEVKILIKKYASLKKELEKLFVELEENPFMGTSIGNNIFKIRLAIASKNKGKSGGARILSYVKVVDSSLLLFSIYNKGEKETVSDSEIEMLINKHFEDEN